MKVKEDSEKAGLKLNIKKTIIMATSPSLHGKQMGNSGNSDRFYFLGVKVTVDRFAALKLMLWKS